MNARFQPANFFAILIAIALMVIGFALYFINEKNTSTEAETPARATAPENASAPAKPLPGDAAELARTPSDSGADQ